jgi:hypothetical protein
MLSLSFLFILTHLLLLILLPVEAEPLLPLPLERLLLFVSEMKVVLLLAKFELYLCNAAKPPFEIKICRHFFLQIRYKRKS